MKNTTHIPNYKKIGLKLWSWQCHRFFDKYGGHDVINYVNELKLKRTQLDILETICRKFHPNWPGSFDVLARTDRHTDSNTHTHRQYGGHDVISYVNELKLECTQLDILETSYGKFYPNRPGSFVVLAQTDRHTDRHTHTYTQTIWRPWRHQLC